MGGRVREREGFVYLVMGYIQLNEQTGPVKLHTAKWWVVECITVTYQ